MNEAVLIDMMGRIDESLLEDEYMENDFWKKHHALKVIMGITASGVIATGGIILAIKMKNKK
jgi:hypothetical protein